MKREWDEAVQHGVLDDLQRLWAAGADVDARDRHGQTALMQAAVRGQAQVATWLIEHGAGLDHRAKYGVSALMLAVINGHTQVVQRLLDAGADRDLRGSGAPGFAGKTALELAADRDDQAMVAQLRTHASSRQTAQRNPHFQVAESWEAARPLLTFEPRQLADTAGQTLQSLQIHVRDHKRRDLPIEDRSLEAHYDRFVFTQSRRGTDEARRLALDVSYGLVPQPATIGGHAARRYALGPVPPRDDIDGRSPAVVVWSDVDMFYLVASSEMSEEDLVSIAGSLYRSTAK